MRKISSAYFLRGTMIQEIAPKKFDNTYCKDAATPDDTVFVFRDGKVLIRYDMNSDAVFPKLSEFSGNVSAQYLFKIEDERYSRAQGDVICPDGYVYESVRSLRHITPLYRNFAVMTAYQLDSWYRENTYCGRCAHKMIPGTKERSMVCPDCGNTVYPKICPAVIIGCVHGDSIIVSRYRGRSYKNYALLAGFVEIGETFEETVQREVYEEVGLKVKNIRYYKSQPWAIDSDFLMGFYCEPDGDFEIKRIDEEELSEALWISRDEMEYREDPVSLTSEMMNTFKKFGNAVLRGRKE